MNNPQDVCRNEELGGEDIAWSCPDCGANRLYRHCDIISYLDERVAKLKERVKTADSIRKVEMAEIRLQEAGYLRDELRSLAKNNSVESDWFDVRKKPVEVEAHGPVEEERVIDTPEGEMLAQPGDYIIKGVEGEKYPIKPDIFKQTYERITKDDIK